MSYSTNYTRFTNISNSLSLSLYMKDLRKYKSLTTEDNMLLAEQVAHGDMKARNKMISGNLCIVLSAYKSYIGCGLPEEDLISAGNEGLIEAVDNYDYTRGVPFYAFARTYIEGAIKDAINEEGSAIRVPRSAKESDDYLYYELDEDGEIVERKVSPVRGICSIDEHICNNEDSRTYADTLVQDEMSDADRLVMDADLRTELEMIMQKRFTPKVQQVIRMRLGLDGHPMQVWEIAEMLGCTKSNVYGILKRIAPDADAAA